MQQLSGSSGLGGTHTPATRALFLRISLRRSRGEDSREEKSIAGPESSTCSLSEDVTSGLEDGEAVVGGLDFMLGVDDSRREA